MKTTPQIRMLHKIVLLGVLAAILLAIVVPHAVDHDVAAFGMVSLVPIFLFGAVVNQGQGSPMVSTGEMILSAAPIRRSLFQLPPPSRSL